VANIEIRNVKALGTATTFHLSYLMLVWWWTPVEFPKLTDNGVRVNGEDGRIYRTASLKIKLAGPVVKPKSFQKDSGFVFTKEHRD